MQGMENCSVNFFSDNILSCEVLTDLWFDSVPGFHLPIEGM